MKEATEADRAVTHGVGASHPAPPASLQAPQKLDSPNTVVQGGEAASSLGTRQQKVLLGYGTSLLIPRAGLSTPPLHQALHCAICAALTDG